MNEYETNEPWKKYEIWKVNLWMREEPYQQYICNYCPVQIKRNLSQKEEHEGTSRIFSDEERASSKNRCGNKQATGANQRISTGESPLQVLAEEEPQR